MKNDIKKMDLSEALDFLRFEKKMSLQELSVSFDKYHADMVAAVSAVEDYVNFSMRLIVHFGIYFSLDSKEPNSLKDLFLKLLEDNVNGKK